MKYTSMWTAVSAVALLVAVSGPVLAQDSQTPVSQLESVGRGAPLPEVTPQVVGPGGPLGGSGSPAREATETQPAREAIPPVIAASGGEAPEGIEPLERDIYTTDDFYLDRDLWTDPRYFRCNSSIGLESVNGAYPGTTDIRGGNPANAPWGFCDRDYPREAIVSPYEFDTAKAHYEALLAEAEARGGPNDYTQAEMPDWSGRYNRTDQIPPWIWMHINQVPTILSLLTEEYQTRFVQQAYHGAVNNAPQWPASYCWPEGFMRYFSFPGTITGLHLYITPDQVMFLGGAADNFIRQIQLGREFNEEGAIPRLGQDVPRWYGETIGFWDGDVLVSWTSNIQGWTTHSAFEHSNQLQTLEIYSPRHGEDGTFLGLLHETVFYDPEALVEPVRLVRNLNRTGNLNEGNPYIFIECNPTIYPIDGFQTNVSPGQTFSYQQPDWFGRPWAQIWEQHFEEGMERPEGEALFGF